MTHATAAGRRIDWVDYGKGICIILVVMMHSTLGVERVYGAESWLSPFIAWARPFRMPDFFLISGLFLASRIDRPWRAYLDTKLVHFAYFYVLWLTIAFAFKGAHYVGQYGVEGTFWFYLTSFVEPYGTLWFIYMLAVFFVVAKLARRVPALVVWLAAAALEIADIHTGSLLVDEFAGRFVYFYSGYVAAPFVFRYAARVGELPGTVIWATLAAWAIVNAWAVATGLAQAPVMSLVFGYLGCGAVVALSVWLARARIATLVRLCGERSLQIYLSFFLFMATSRIVIAKSGLVADAGAAALLVTAAGVVGPLVLHELVRRTRLKFLFARPGLFRLNAAPDAVKVRPSPA